MSQYEENPALLWMDPRPLLLLLLQWYRWDQFVCVCVCARMAADVSLLNLDELY